MLFRSLNCRWHHGGTRYLIKLIWSKTVIFCFKNWKLWAVWFWCTLGHTYCLSVSCTIVGREIWIAMSTAGCCFCLNCADNTELCSFDHCIVDEKCIEDVVLCMELCGENCFTLVRCSLEYILKTWCYICGDEMVIMRTIIENVAPV